MPAHQTIAEFGFGEPFERRPRQKLASGLTTPTIYELSNPPPKPPHREFDLTVGTLAPTFKDRDVTSRRMFVENLARPKPSRVQRQRKGVAY
jgi:hypothetical protein